MVVTPFGCRGARLRLRGDQLPYRRDKQIGLAGKRASFAQVRELQSPGSTVQPVVASHATPNQWTSMLRNCQGSFTSTSSGNKADRRDSGLQSVKCPSTDPRYGNWTSRQR